MLLFFNKKLFFMKVIVTWFIYLNHFTFSFSRIDNHMQKHQKVQNIPRTDQNTFNKYYEF